MPPHIVFKKIVSRFFREYHDRKKRSNDLNKDGRIEFNVPTIKNTLLDIAKLDISGLDVEAAQFLSSMYISHRFDLLGSGWIKYSYDSTAPGLEKNKYIMNVPIDDFEKNGEWLRKILLPIHFKKSREIWTQIDHSYGYAPIDWQKDHKSGFRWNSTTWYKDQPVMAGPGIDIKMPWELSRFQHLPQMAIFSILLPELKEKLIIEFKNQVLDFIAANPPRFGVNWVCTMDIGIRAANILLAFDIFSQVDSNNILNDEFRQSLSNSIFEHGLHIVNNLEYSEVLTTNHYLSDIAGLLFVSAYLLNSDSLIDDEIKLWLVFSVQEIIEEMKKEFLDDGGNFEASTSYHRLSGEIITYCTALIKGLIKNEKIINIFEDYECGKWKRIPKLNNKNGQKYDCHSARFFPQWYIDRLFKAGMFTTHITKPTGEISQIGDNDSGRFFRLSPVGKLLDTKIVQKKYDNLKECDLRHERYWDENILDHSGYISALNGLFENDCFRPHSGAYPLEKSIVKSLSGGKKLFPRAAAFSNTHLIRKASKSELDNIKAFEKTTVFEPKTLKDRPLDLNMKLYIYPNFGLYIFRSERVHLTISAGPNGQNGLGGHSHNDKGSFELSVDGIDVVVDPGTYVYTPIPQKRNAFRSVRSHNTIIADDMEQNNWEKGNDGLFTMYNQSNCNLLDFGKNFLKIEVTYGKIIHVREFIISKVKIEIIDKSNVDFKTNFNNYDYLSNGYGKIIRKCDI